MWTNKLQWIFQHLFSGEDTPFLNAPGVNQMRMKDVIDSEQMKTNRGLLSLKSMIP